MNRFINYCILLVALLAIAIQEASPEVSSWGAHVTKDSAKNIGENMKCVTFKLTNKRNVAANRFEVTLTLPNVINFNGTGDSDVEWKPLNVSSKKYKGKVFLLYKNQSIGKRASVKLTACFESSSKALAYKVDGKLFISNTSKTTTTTTVKGTKTISSSTKTSSTTTGTVTPTAY